MIRRIAALSALLLFGAGFSAPPAQADTPPRTVFFNIGSFVSSELCGFPLVASFNERFTDIITFDSNGDPLIDNFHLLGFVQAENPANGKILYTKEDVQARFQFPDLVAATVVGINGNFRLPGVGIATMEVGRLVFDADGNVTFEAGLHFGDFPHQQDFCAALADP
jgi:hypothetical protein